MGPSQPLRPDPSPSRNDPPSENSRSPKFSALQNFSACPKSTSASVSDPLGQPRPIERKSTGRLKKVERQHHNGLVAGPKTNGT
jgi:hypothetical protein